MLSDLFLVSLFLYLAAVRIDLSLEGLISRAVPLNSILLICMLAGIGAVLLPSDQERVRAQRAPVRLWIYAVLLSTFIGSIIAEILRDLSPWALLMGCAGGFIVFLVCFAIIRQD